MDADLVEMGQDAAELGAIEPLPEPPALGRRFFNVRTLLSFGVAAVIIYFFFRQANLNVGATWQHIQSANVPLFLLAVFVYYLTFPLRTVRWRWLLHNVGLNRGPGAQSLYRLGEILMLSWFANCIVPAKLGDGYRAYLFRRDGRASFSRTIGTILAERLIDISVMVVLLVISALLLFRGASAMGNAVTEAGIAMLILIVTGLLGMRILGSRAHRVLPRRVHAIYEQLHHGTLGSFRQMPALTFLTLLIWFAEATRLFLVTHALGVSVSFLLVLFCSLTNSLLTALPLTPGGLGLVEAGMAGVLMTALSKDDAMSVAILDRVITYWSILAVGLVLYLYRSRRRGAVVKGDALSGGEPVAETAGSDAAPAETAGRPWRGAGS